MAGSTSERQLSLSFPVISSQSRAVNKRLHDAQGILRTAEKMLFANIEATVLKGRASKPYTEYVRVGLEGRCILYL